jgi:hypothetical protein
VDKLNIKYFRGKLMELLALLRHPMGIETPTGYQFSYYILYIIITLFLFAGPMYAGWDAK